jgi:OmpA-OmpF porin, OOP family
MAQVTSTTPDLMGIVNRQITPDVIRSFATELSEDRGSTASALSATVPSVLTALSDVTSSDTGARHLKAVIDEKRAAPQGDEDRSLFSSGALTSHDHATTLIDDELGSRSDSIAAAVASSSGIKAESAHKLMGGVASATVAALAKTSGGLGSGALQSIFREQRGQWVQRLPRPVASLFNGHGRVAAVPIERAYDERIVTGPAIRELEAPRRNWVIPLIVVALALLAISLMRGMRRPRAPALPAAPQVTAPVPAPGATPPVETRPTPPTEEAPAAPEPAAVEPGTTDDLEAYLAGTGETTPHAFAPTPLNFPFASAKPTSESMGTIDDIASALNAHPSATIRVESHTDNVGTEESNLNLSQARAEAIKSELIARGIDGARIETAGMGQELPVASNDTAEGRAENRRAEIIVTAR